MKITLDTSAYSGFNRGDKRLQRFFTIKNQILIPIITIAELRAGFALGARASENEALLQRLLDAPNVSVFTITDQTTRLFATIFSQLKQAGTPINTNDIWIAALTIEHQATLVTLDSDFQRVPGLKLAKLSQAY